MVRRRRTAMSASLMRGLRMLVPVAFAVLVCGCGSLSAGDARGQILVVDTLGAPIKGALVLPDPEFPPAEAPRLSDSDIKERSTNAQGMILVYLDDFYWNADACYHIRVRSIGYEDETLAVSKDLFPAVLKIDMRPRVAPTLPAPSGRRS
jgi:hypothetical protein